MAKRRTYSISYSDNSGEIVNDLCETIGTIITLIIIRIKKGYKLVSIYDNDFVN